MSYCKTIMFQLDVGKLKFAELNLQMPFFFPKAHTGDTTLGSWRSHFQDGCFHLRITKTLDTKVIIIFFCKEANKYPLCV